MFRPAYIGPTYDRDASADGACVGSEGYWLVSILVVCLQLSNRHQECNREMFTS